MKIAILSQNNDLYSTQRLKKSGEDQGHQIEVINYLCCHANITASNPYLLYKGKILENFDAIIPRIGGIKSFYGTAIVRQFELMGTFTPNNSQAIALSRNKLSSLQALAREGITIPKTGFVHDAQDIDSLIDSLGGTPLIIKILEGSQGIGVILAENRQSAKSIIEAFQSSNINILIQEYIEEAQGSDIRCFIIDNKIVASMQRQSPQAEFRSNIHRGGQATKMKLTAKEKSIALKSAKILGLKLAGVDLLRSQNGPLVIEVNSSPGLKGIEKISGINLADKIIQFVASKIIKNHQLRP